jgi:heme-degrading monooxygenase HmoA
MVVEVARIVLRPGCGAEFERAVQEVVPLFRRAQGCRGMQITRCLESPDTYRLVVRWDTLDNHLIDFRSSADFATWKTLLGRFVAGPIEVENTVPIGVGF